MDRYYVFLVEEAKSGVGKNLLGGHLEGGQPKPFVSPLIDWLAWLGLARLASAWLSRPQTTATTPEEADKTTGAALRAAPVVVAASSGVVAVVCGRESHAEARLAKPSQASQSIKGLTNGFGYKSGASFNKPLRFFPAKSTFFEKEGPHWLIPQTVLALRGSYGVGKEGGH